MQPTIAAQPGGALPGVAAGAKRTCKFFLLPRDSSFRALPLGSSVAFDGPQPQRLGAANAGGLALPLGKVFRNPVSPADVPTEQTRYRPHIRRVPILIES